MFSTTTNNNPMPLRFNSYEIYRFCKRYGVKEKNFPSDYKFIVANKNLRLPAEPSEIEFYKKTFGITEKEALAKIEKEIFEKEYIHIPLFEGFDYNEDEAYLQMKSFEPIFIVEVSPENAIDLEVLNGYSVFSYQTLESYIFVRLFQNGQYYDGWMELKLLKKLNYNK